MKKTHFVNELKISQSVKRGNRGKNVKKVQEWLNLQSINFQGTTIATTIDGDFGYATELSVKNFQAAIGLPQTGIVDQPLFAKLSEPLSKSYQTTTELPTEHLRNLMVGFANKHLSNKSRELQYGGQSNLGPFVRAYCDGSDGNVWYWCMGFVQTILDLAMSVKNKSFTTFMPQTLSCDVVAQHAKSKGTLIKNSQIRTNPALVKKGDIILLKRANSEDWYHTGIVTNVTNDCFETIEGNTDVNGSNNGTGVFAKTRNFRDSIIDVVSIESIS